MYKQVRKSGSGSAIKLCNAIRSDRGHTIIATNLCETTPDDVLFCSIWEELKHLDDGVHDMRIVGVVSDLRRRY